MQSPPIYYSRRRQALDPDFEKQWFGVGPRHDAAIVDDKACSMTQAN
jgi:hypothetical protein